MDHVTPASTLDSILDPARARHTPGGSLPGIITARPRSRPLRRPRRTMVAGAAGLLALGLAGQAHAQLVEPDARVIRLFEGDEVGDGFGWVSADLGDLDGDGVRDMAIASLSRNAGAGRVSIVGGADGASLATVDGQPGQARGYSVETAGDVDGDGVPDYVVGGGRVEVYSGADHTLLHDFTAVTGFGHSVRGVGDLDGDGLGDVVVGRQGASFSFPAAGRLFALSGGSGELLWTRDGDAPGALLGSALGAMGDVNGDGVPDIVAGAFGSGPASGGEAFLIDGTDGTTIRLLAPVDPTAALFFGQFFASGVGDIDRDGIVDAFVADYGASQGTGEATIYSGRTGRVLRHVPGVRPGDGMGPGRGVGDVDGDRVPDFIVAAWTASDGAPSAGKAYVFSGRSGALLRTFTALLEGDNFGVDAMSPGDTDGDGLPDYLVTAVGRSFVGLDVGRAYLLAGTVLPCPADLDGDRRVGAFDLVRLLDLIVHERPGGDLDGDEATDLADLEVLLRSLGLCPPGRPR
jgi:hypothetical protein